jgi:hypothetical protein
VGSNVRNLAWWHYSSRHQIACFKATEGLPPLTARLWVTIAAISELSSLAWATLFCYNVVRFLCDLEACSLVTATRASIKARVVTCCL